jgi:uncharacterized protein GlcG (DUF336 family)
MSRSLFAPLGAAVLACFVASAQAQQPAVNPLDAVPERMPFDIPYGLSISLEKADAVLTAALAESTKRNWKLICAVADPAGYLVSFKRMDNAQIGSVDIAIHKARAAAKFRRETKIFETAMTMNNFTYIATLDDAIASRGGIPLVEGGKLVGAIGCSGGTGSQDEVVAKAGAALVK